MMLYFHTISKPNVNIGDILGLFVFNACSSFCHIFLAFDFGHHFRRFSCKHSINSEVL